MKNSHPNIITLFIISIFYTTIVIQSQPINFNNIFQENKEAVVLISTYNLDGNQIALGTGFIVGSDGYIITNYHVIIGACSIEVKLWDERKFLVKQFDVHESIDVALLKIDAQNLQIVKLGDIKTTGVNDSVIVISNPGGLRNILSTGKVINIANSTFDVDAVVTHGSSGGPVFDIKGYVIGFIVAGIRNSMINKAIVINEAKRLLERKRTETFICDIGGEIQRFFQLGISSASQAKWNDALKYFNMVLQKQPGNLGTQLQIAKIHQDRGFYQLAILRYEIIRKNSQYLEDESALADLFFNRGVCFTKINLYDEAVADFQSVLKLRNKNLSCKSFYNLYVAYYNTGEYNLAINNFYKALGCAPELILPSQWLSVGDCYLKLGQLDSAQVVMHRADKEIKYYLYLRDLYIQKADTIKAIGILKEGVENYPLDFSLWFQLGNLYFDLKNYPEAIKAYDTSSSIEPSSESVNYNRCASYLNLSIRYLTQNHFTKCLEALKLATRCDTLKEKIDNIKFEVYSAIGLEQYNKSNFATAIDTLKLALEIRRNVWSVWYNLGLAYSKNRENEEALISFTKAVELAEDSSRAKAHLQRGSIYISVNKPWRAIEDFKKAISLPESAHQISLTFLSMGEDSLINNNYSKAIALADSALLYDASNSGAYFLRGKAMMLLGNSQKALIDFKKIQRNSNIFDRVPCARVQIFLEIGIQDFNHARYTFAEDTLKLALDEISKCDDSQFRSRIQPKIWSMLGIVYSETQRYIDAINAYTRAIELNREYPQYWYRRAYARYRLADHIQARKDVQTAIKLDLEYADGHKLLFEICLQLLDFNESCKECKTLEKLNIDDLNNSCRIRIQQRFGDLCPD